MKNLFQEAAKGHNGASVQVSALSPEEAPVLITRPEFMRRFREMQALQGMGGMADFPDSFNVVVNSNNPVIVNKLVKAEGAAAGEMTEYLLSLALLQQGMLKGEALTSFVRKTLEKV